MPTPTIPAGNLFMNATLYTGNNTSQTITNGVAGQSFQPDFVWIKSRSTVANNVLSDSVRGVSKWLISDTTEAELSGAGYIVTAFNSNGFNVGLGTSANQPAGTTFVGWQWKAGGTAVTNTAGTITSSVSANTTSGFSVVTYSITSASSSISTFGHGLGVAPSMVFLKVRNAVDEWTVYHSALSAPTTSWLTLNTTNAVTGSTSTFSSSSSTFGVRDTRLVGVGGSGNVVAYCWAPIAGYSAFGSYTGNGSTDGPFIYTGFRPKWVMIKRLNGVGDWTIWNSSMDSSNVVGTGLYADLANAESTGNAAFDFVSNGFKIRNTFTNINVSGSTYIYAAFAENPFKYANAR